MTGRIQKAISGFYYVDTGDSALLTCRARGKFRKTGVSPLVGDRVECTVLGGGEGVIEAIMPRQNAFDRPAVANIDQLVIVASKAIPRTEPYLIDRMTAIAARTQVAQGSTIKLTVSLGPEITVPEPDATEEPASETDGAETEADA